MKPELVIVGAGLSGLLLAYILQERFQITLLEARPRIGGRILTFEETGTRFDLGPTWVWPHQPYIRALAESLGLDLVRHYDSGAFAYDAPGGVQYYRSGTDSPSYRFKDGASALTDALYHRLENVELRLDTPVNAIIHDDEKIAIRSGSALFYADKCIITLPPRLCAESILFDPPLPEHDEARMKAVPTWMAFSAKCIVTYAEPFWRGRGLSGLATSHIGPLSEVHDASAGTKGALFGFYGTQAADDATEAEVIDQLVRLFGPEAGQYEHFRRHNWRTDPFTSTPADRQPLSSHPRYGLEASWEGRIHLCGSETSATEGGYLEGAVIAATQLAKRLGNGDAV
jgi:monoamine oxidase